MPQLRSATSTHGRNMAGARALWRATGMTDADFGKPIVAIANSFTQFVPGHVHLKDMGGLVADAVAEAGGVGREFNTIAVDDGIAMGHGGMLYSLPSRELIADAVEYMVNAHCADALVCISNCDKITPGMLMAALRLNIPAVFVSGGPMEAGKIKVKGKEVALDLVDAMGGSTNTVLHLLAAAHEARVDFTMRDIDRLSRRVPVLCKVAPAKSDVHMEDVHRAGGIMAILGELDRAGLINRDVPTVHAATLGQAIERWDVAQSENEEVRQFYRAAPGGVPTQVAFSQERRWKALD